MSRRTAKRKNKAGEEYLNLKIEDEEYLKIRAEFERINKELDAAELEYFG